MKHLALLLVFALFSLSGESAEGEIDLDRNETAIVLIEFQQEWIGDDAFLRDRLVLDREAFDQTVANASRVVNVARTHDWMIAHAGLDLRADPHYLIFGRGKDVLGLRKAIPRVGTWTGDGARFVEPFVPREGEYIVQGRSGASVLANSTLDPFLRNNRIHTLVLMGFATHVCVESTLRDAHDRGYNVLVVTDACGAFETRQNEWFRKHVLHHFGKGITSAELIRQLAGE